MITSAMVFMGTVSALASLAAWTADDGLRRFRWATRWVWLAALAAGVVLFFVPLAFSSAAGSAMGQALGFIPVVELPAIVITPGGGLGWTTQTLDVALGALWIFSSLSLISILVRTQRGLIRERREWDVSEVVGRDVYLSSDRGPAVAGVLRPWIVLPRWVLALPSSELKLVVLHEVEHVRARDTALLAAALFFVVLTPWNPITWWQLRRLRMAMEMDCDRRVLSLEPDRERYGCSLLSVAARASGTSLGLAAFTERSLSLKVRIMAMTTRNSRRTPLRACLLLLLSTAVAVQACAVESPVAIGIDGEAVARSDVRAQDASGIEIDIRATPTFTPFTVAPSITNRTEVIAAMSREYPPLLREAGVGGTVRMYFFIEADGSVDQVRIDQSSGHPALDDAALKVAGVFGFTSARNGDDPVPVWVSFPITFQAR